MQLVRTRSHRSCTGPKFSTNDFIMRQTHTKEKDVMTMDAELAGGAQNSGNTRHGVDPKTLGSRRGADPSRSFPQGMGSCQHFDFRAQREYISTDLSHPVCGS